MTTLSKQTVRTAVAALRNLECCSQNAMLRWMSDPDLSENRRNLAIAELLQSQAEKAEADRYRVIAKGAKQRIRKAHQGKRAAQIEADMHRRAWEALVKQHARLIASYERHVKERGK